ncbi:Carotenogenesis protein CarS [Stigmatella sp. ncwal1]|uniref:Carotenogenesis protein CarS n=1 Tax=Stigmatella ashevillensis TaxID=2995309 RepID=A0ABT5DC79_9BACT|nr:Carotenogenesis protein CarS [Stigmatella ashevillena]MDC0711277.1 Carotenogenesis protein CarS [Stigmatella ashevillena]
MIRDPSLIVTVDVEGAPVRIGEPVRIVTASQEDSVDQRFLGRTGIVVALVFDDPWLQYPADPLIRVRVHGLGEDLFFVRELDGVSERVGPPFRALPPARAC